MNRLVICVLLTICLTFIVEGRTARDNIFEVKEANSLNSQLFQDSIEEIHSRERRSTAAKSYVLFDNRSGRTVQLWYRKVGTKTRHAFRQLKPGDTLQVVTFNTDEWKARTLTKVGIKLEINDKRWYAPTNNTEADRTLCVIKRLGEETPDLGEKYIETLIVVDKSAHKRHKNEEEAEKYIKVLFDFVTKIFQHKSLKDNGVNVRVVPSQIVFLENEVKFDPDKESGNLYTACGKMNDIAENSSRKFDHKIFITRNSFGAGGYARKFAMCSQYSGCSMVYEHGFSSAFLIAHEMAHSFGVSHGDFPQYSRHIMAAFVDSNFNKFQWSTKSQHVMLAEVRRYTCLNNKVEMETEDKLPGRHFSLEKQCHLEYDNTYSAYKQRSFHRSLVRDPCQDLRCSMAAPWEHLSKSTGSPALDGTDCSEPGEKKWCLRGKCETTKSEQSVMGRLL